jgi:HAD superfamily hydrolase (TIGR01549 family)
MGNTFMFDCDRFDDTVELFGAYRDAGGRSLNEVRLAEIVGRIVSRMGRLYSDPAAVDSFPSVGSAVLEETAASGRAELAAIEAAIAHQELGQIPADHIEVLQRLSKRFAMGVVSNVWSRSKVFRRAFQEAGVLDLFEVIVFSSDGSSIKPSGAIFQAALEGLPLEARSRVCFVGDDAERDVVGAGRLGMEAVWISSDGSGWARGDREPRWIVRQFSDLLDLDWRCKAT